MSSPRNPDRSAHKPTQPKADAPAEVRVYSHGWYYASDVPSTVQEQIPAGKPALIDDNGQYGFPVYSSGGYCVQMVAPAAPQPATNTQATARAARLQRERDKAAKQPAKAADRKSTRLNSSHSSPSRMPSSA